MPDDSNGIYNVPSGTLVNTGDTVLPSQHNPWALDSSQAISNRFSKDGRSPATGNWDLNTFRITGMGDGVSAADAVTKQQMEKALDAKLSKSGGTLTGDVLFGPGTGGKYSKLQANGDIQLNRGDNTGFMLWNAPDAFFGWNGNRFFFGRGGPVHLTGNYLRVENPEGTEQADYYGTGDIKFGGFMSTAFGPYLSAALGGFISSQQSFAAGGLVTVAHSLGAVPSQIVLDFVCVAADLGFSPGDTVKIYPADTFSNNGLTAWADATNVYVRMSSAAISFGVKTTGTGQNIVPANWRMVVRAKR